MQPGALSRTSARQQAIKQTLRPAGFRKMFAHGADFELQARQ
jgi:hypothetical protein